MNKLKFLLTGALLAWSALAVHAADDNVTTKTNITYKTTAQGPLRLDIHYPEAPRTNARYPLVLYTHGGGWSAGNKSIGNEGPKRMIVTALNARGFCVASVDYRLCTKDGSIVVKDCVTDSKDALRYLAKNARPLSLDANHAFTFGDSAGGHIAQMLLLAPPEAFPGDPALANAGFQVVAGVSWYGPCDFEKEDLFSRDGEPVKQDRFAGRMLRGNETPEEKIAVIREMSPVNYLKSNSLPLLMLQGDQDKTIPVAHARHMKERAEAVQAPVEIIIVKNASHGWKQAGGPLDPSLEEIIRKTADFMERNLGRSAK